MSRSKEGCLSCHTRVMCMEPRFLVSSEGTAQLLASIKRKGTADIFKMLLLNSDFYEISYQTHRRHGDVDKMKIFSLDQLD